MNEAIKTKPPEVVYIVDGWNDDTQKSIIKVFSSRQRAERELARLEDKAAVLADDLYIGIVKRTIL
jgi:uncharacterized protein YfcZ (UPF0381/DUF406 family)